MTTTLTGTALLRDPRLNKSTAFTVSERETLGLVGLVPEGIDNEDTQIQRLLFQLRQKPTDLGIFKLTIGSAESSESNTTSPPTRATPTSRAFDSEPNDNRATDSCESTC